MCTRTIAALTLCGAALLFSTNAAAQFSGGALAVNVPVSGVFSPGLPMDHSGKPFVDYHFFVNVPGSYQIDLRSTNTSVYDPYLILMQNGMQIDRNDDGGGSLNSRISRFLQPGQYIVRVTRFGSGQISFPVPFTLAVVMAAAPMPQPPVYGGSPLTEPLARVLATQFYSSQSEWANQYAITILRTRMMPTGPDAAVVHIQYRYTCLNNRCRGARTGMDQRIFYYQRFGAQWRVVRMGPHMSAVF